MQNPNAPKKIAHPPDLRAKYQLAPQPVNVSKISGLVKGRSSASMDEITEIISDDSGVTQRLLSLAFPKQQARLGATVQMATSRLGVNRVIVVLVGDLLGKAVIETFQTMASVTLQPVDPNTLTMDHGYLTGSVCFKGEAMGRVTLGFSPHLSLLVTAHLMGGEMGADDHTPEVINDAIGELVNIVTGNLQSKLSDAGLPSEVGLPEVKYMMNLPSSGVEGGSFDQFYFRSGVHHLVVQLSVDPSAQKAAALRAPPTKGTTWRANGA